MFGIRSRVIVVNAPLILTLFAAILLCTNAHILGIAQGKPCNGGMCILLPECTSIRDFKITRPDICSFQGKTPIICCPSSESFMKLKQSQTTSRPGMKARRECLEYENKHCGKNSNTEWNIHKGIVGGSPSNPKDLTFMAQIGYMNGYDKAWQCGGTLISNYWVMSAAHCEMSMLKNAKWILLGALDNSKTDDTKPIIYDIELTVLHPEFNYRNYNNDLSLHKSKVMITFNDYVLPICIETNFPSLNESPWIAGWGTTEFGGPRSSILLKAKVYFIRSDHCIEDYRDTKLLSRGIDFKTKICTSSIGNETSCQGDSGGPLFQYHEIHCLKRQIGIVSFGKRCDNSSSVYTWTLHYLKWIEDNVWPDEQ